MESSQKYIKNLIFGGDSLKVVKNTPEQYNSRNKQYLAERTTKYAAERAFLSSDYVKADIQGLKQYFYDYTTLNIRLADIVSPSASTTKRTDDFKQILIPDTSVDYLPIGAKINTMGSYWLVIDPSNISSVITTSVIARCNATYKSYDYYGNIIVEPIIVEKYTMSGNDNDNSINLVLMDGYFNITCQLNDNTRNLGINQRIILGDKPYHITGFTDFIQEFTYTPYVECCGTAQFTVNATTGELSVVYPQGYNGPAFTLISPNLYQIGQTDKCIYIKDGKAYLREKNSYKTHLITFTARLDEPTERDDTALGIANGKNYIVSAELNGQTSLIVGQQALLTANFLINGKVVDETAEYPLSWEYLSDNNKIVEITENGTIRALNQGNAQITARLRQNPLVKATIELSVSEAVNEPYVAFDGFVSDFISQYDKEVLSAFYYENDVKTAYPLKWSFSGAMKRAYNATISNDGNSVEIECISSSDTPLKITASYNGKKKSVKINLLGY